MKKIVVMGILGTCLFACTPTTTHSPGTPPRTPDFDDIKDSGPERPIDTSHVPDAVPRYEARTIAGNKNPYTVLGKTYHLLEDESSYKERGRASWYGKKFHGRRTSNGEIYDMYAMTAAHKTLPIPSYVRVTNLQNGKSAVVRVNDRGPFHSGRIIDLSYAAAQRLGILNAGTGLVEVEIVLPDDAPPVPLKAKPLNDVVPGSKLPANTHLQIGAFSAEASAKQFAAQVATHLAYPVIISPSKTDKVIYRVRVGPITDARELQQVRHQIEQLKIPQAHVVYE
jgi:rare lipoprotein A